MALASRATDILFRTIYGRVNNSCHGPHRFPCLVFAFSERLLLTSCYEGGRQMQEQVMHRASSVVVVLSVGEGLCSADSFYLCMELFTTQ